jgi:hypothetical protein
MLKIGWFDLSRARYFLQDILANLQQSQSWKSVMESILEKKLTLAVGTFTVGHRHSSAEWIFNDQDNGWDSQGPSSIFIKGQALLSSRAKLYCHQKTILKRWTMTKVPKGAVAVAATDPPEFTVEYREIIVTSIGKEAPNNLWLSTHPFLIWP